MTQLKVPVRVVFYRAEERWWAHCLEFDLMGDGSTQTEALHSLSVAIEMVISDSIEHGELASVFSPADGDVFLRFAAGTKSGVDGAELLLEVPQIRIEHPELREFLGTLDEVRDEEKRVPA